MKQSKKTEKVKLSGELENRDTLTLITSENNFVGRESKILNDECEHDILKIGSSIKFCRLAEGKADIYPRFGPTSEWDIAAAHAVLLSYGGSIVKIKDKQELDYAKESSILNPYFIAFRNNSLKSEFLPVLRDFFKKLV